MKAALIFTLMVFCSSASDLQQRIISEQQKRSALSKDIATLMKEQAVAAKALAHELEHINRLIAITLEARSPKL